ncbi:MAG: hypothetical protein JWQ00_2999 [Noviherbaspirillum sp.]|nr:hypothetical protein [Noviherbaspirillum sp.]
MREIGMILNAGKIAQGNISRKARAASANGAFQQFHYTRMPNCLPSMRAMTATPKVKNTTIIPTTDATS